VSRGVRILARSRSWSFLLREAPTPRTYNESYNENFACTLLYTVVHLWLEEFRFSLRSFWNTQWLGLYITLDAPESESEIWARSRSPTENKDSASLFKMKSWTRLPFPQIDIIGAMVIVWRVRGKIITSVLCNIVLSNCAQCSAHTWTDLTVLWIEFCLTGPISLCLDSFLRM